MPLFIPKDYTAKLAPETMEQAITHLKNIFPAILARDLRLRRVTAPLFVLSGTGINDDLNGTERAVSFPIKDMGDRRAEVVHSLAKWKRMKLAAYKIAPGYGLYTDMNAIRADEELDNIHSLYVDQWDWERTMRPEERTLDYLKDTVRCIYSALRAVEQEVYELFPHITPCLPDEITFIQSEDLLARYPGLTPKERENEAARQYGAVFIIGIGHPLSHGERHDGRAPDYDDWSTPTYDPDGAGGAGGEYFGLNGDILVWNPVLESSLELSSMGIRVDGDTLRRQLAMTGQEGRAEMEFHRALLDGRLPLSIGGGIGQSRLCMFYLRCAHIGEVQVSMWPEAQIAACARHGIYLK
jgi:aspartate--ammonia ligase